jgi:hypothetical protein
MIQIEDTDEGPVATRSQGARIQVGGLVQILAGALLTVDQIQRDVAAAPAIAGLACPGRPSRS